MYSFWDWFLHRYVCMCQLCNNYLLTIFSIFDWIKFGVLVHLLSNDFGYIHLSLVAEMILVYSITLIWMKVPLFHWLTLVVYHPCGWPQTPFINLSPHWPPQHTKLEILWLGLNINLYHSWATADPRPIGGCFVENWDIFCQIFQTGRVLLLQICWIVKPIFPSIQRNLTEFHQGNVILEISLFLHLCVAVLGVPVGWHWLWGNASLYSHMLRYSSLKWVMI